MSWAQAASLGLSLLSGSASRSAQKLNNFVEGERAKAENVVREGKNIENAAKASFGGFMASVNNQRAMTAAGKAEESARLNLGRVQDAMTRGSIEAQIANAEAAGAFAASVAMAGAGGGSTDAIARTMRLRSQRADFMQRDKNKAVNYDMLKQIAGIVPQTIQGLDIGTYSAPIDYSRSFGNIKPVMGNALFDAASWAAGNPGAAGDLQQAGQSAWNGFFRADPNQSTWRLMGDTTR